MAFPADIARGVVAAGKNYARSVPCFGSGIRCLALSQKAERKGCRGAFRSAQEQITETSKPRAVIQ